VSLADYRRTSASGDDPFIALLLRAGRPWTGILAKLLPAAETAAGQVPLLRKPPTGVDARTRRPRRHDFLSLCFTHRAAARGTSRPRERTSRSETGRLAGRRPGDRRFPAGYSLWSRTRGRSNLSYTSAKASTTLGLAQLIDGRRTQHGIALRGSLRARSVVCYTELTDESGSFRRTVD